MAKNKAEYVETSLTSSGFVLNYEKSQWAPTRQLTWLGVRIDLSAFVMKITDKRVSLRIKNVRSILESLPYTTARQLAKLAGKIISATLVLGDVARLKTRNLYWIIESAPTWDGKLVVRDETDYRGPILEFCFERLNRRILTNYRIPRILAGSDASQSDY